MLHKLLKVIVDKTLGNSLLRQVLIRLFGYNWVGFLLSLTSYRAVHMVDAGETCLLAGIFSHETVRNFSDTVGVGGKVIVVEANPNNIEELKKKTSNIKNVTIINKAIWNSKGDMEFLYSQKNKAQGYNRLNSDNLQKFPLHIDSNPMKVKVPTDNILGILEEVSIDKLDHINMTINGAELQALEDLPSLKKLNPNIRIYINSQIPDPALEVIKKLKIQNYKVFISHMIRTTNTKIKLVRIYAC